MSGEAVRARHAWYAGLALLQRRGRRLARLTAPAERQRLTDVRRLPANCRMTCRPHGTAHPSTWCRRTVNANDRGRMEIDCNDCNEEVVWAEALFFVG